METLAQIPFPPLNLFVAFIWGLLGLLLIASLVLTVIVQWKKAFGRIPSLDVILSGLVSVSALNEYKEEVRLRTLGLEKQVSDARHDFDARVNADLKRTLEMFDAIAKRGEQRDSAIAEMQRTISRLQERTETHIRQLDQNDTKMTNLLREVAAASAVLKDAAQRATAKTA